MIRYGWLKKLSTFLQSQLHVGKKGDIFINQRMTVFSITVYDLIF